MKQEGRGKKQQVFHNDWNGRQHFMVARKMMMLMIMTMTMKIMMMTMISKGGPPCFCIYVFCFSSCEQWCQWCNLGFDALSPFQGLMDGLVGARQLMGGLATATTSPPLSWDEISPDQVSEDVCQGGLTCCSNVMTELIVCFFTLSCLPAGRLLEVLSQM